MDDPSRLRAVAGAGLGNKECCESLTDAGQALVVWGPVNWLPFTRIHKEDCNTKNVTPRPWLEAEMS